MQKMSSASAAVKITTLIKEASNEVDSKNEDVIVEKKPFKRAKLSEELMRLIQLLTWNGFMYSMLCWKCRIESSFQWEKN